MRTIRGKRALVTGAASGIGRAIALRLADEGADLWLLDINQQTLGEVVEEAHRRGVRAIGRRVNLADAAQVRHAVQDVLKTWGHVDLLVNNAGVCYYGPTIGMSDQQWEQLMAVNLHAPIEITRQLLPTLLDRPDAHILNVASMYGFVATNRCAAYHVSKYGMLGFSEALRAEYGRSGLGVTALCPGFVATELFTSMTDDAAKHAARRPPRWVTATPERVAEKAVRGIYRDRRMVLVTPLAYAVYYLRRIAPGLIDSMYRIGRGRKLRQKQALLASRANAAMAEQPRKAA